jgi:hypothetical protein
LLKIELTKINDENLNRSDGTGTKYIENRSAFVANGLWFFDNMSLHQPSARTPYLWATDNCRSL